MDENEQNQIKELPWEKHNEENNNTEPLSLDEIQEVISEIRY